MKIHRSSVGRFTVFTVACLAVAGVASADIIGECSLTGYTFMGGGSAYVSTPAGSNAKDYFTASSLNWDFDGMNMWGFAWAKFDNLELSPVAEAYVTFDLVGVGAMGSAPASPATPATLLIYDPGDVDVSDLGGSAAVRAALRDALDASGTPLGTLTMVADGTYSLNVTDLYNDWVADPSGNHGLVFVAPDDSDASQYASFGHPVGTAPFISTVPEPATMGVLAVGGLAVLRRRRT